MIRAILKASRGLAVIGLAAAAHIPAHAQNSFAEDTSRNTPPAQRPGANGSPSHRSQPSPPDHGPSAPAGTQTQAQAPDDPRFAEVARIEAEDFGIAPTDKLREGAMHAPTPTRIPGGLVITTEALNALYQNNAGQFIVFDILGGERGLPGAQNALPAAQGGSFADQTQRDFGGYLEQVTKGNKSLPLIFYCQSVYCWMSYNAALRAINMGYTQVLWYRGGIEAWQKAGLQTNGRQK